MFAIVINGDENLPEALEWTGYTLEDAERRLIRHALDENKYVTAWILNTETGESFFRRASVSVTLF